MPNRPRDWTRGPAKRLAAWTLAALACAGLALTIRAADRASPLLVAPRAGDGAPALEAPSQALSPVDLNTATEAELDLLPGIGPAIAARIVEDRRARGPFKSVDDLDRVPGIGARTVARLRALATVSTPEPRPAPAP